MAWRGTTTTSEKIYGALPYLLPILEVLPLGLGILALLPSAVMQSIIPVVVILSLPMTLLNQVLGGYGSLVIFFALFMLVVRNDNIKHFIRFNTMQAMLIGIAVSLVQIVLSLLGISVGVASAGMANLDLLGSTLLGTLFLGGMAASLYSIFQSLRGKYAEIPVVSEAAYAQVR